MLRRGTTPTILFSLPFDTSIIRNCEIYFSQNDSLLLTKELKDMVLSGTYLAVTLSQEESLLLDEEEKCEIQIRFMFTDGSVDSTTIRKDKVYKILKEGVIEDV